MMVFWILAALAAALAALAVLTAARRAQDVSGETPDTLRAQAGAVELAALDRLHDQGQLGDEDWQVARAEAGRRILNAVPLSGIEIGATTTAEGQAPRLLPLAIALAVLAALGLYWVVGQPGLPDQPYERRVSAWASGDEPLEPTQIAAVLERAARETPDQPRLWQMLGAARFEAGDAIGAASAFRRTLALEPNDAQSWARLGESLVRANGGQVGADAEGAFVQALKLDPDQFGARYFLGEAALARGEMARVRELWLPLIAVLSPDDPRRADLLARLPEVGA